VLALLVQSQGPVFYTDRRLGRRCRLQSCLKFGTMMPDAEASLRMLAEDAGMFEYSSTTSCATLRHPVGRFLRRRTSFDELPQLWNVARGDEPGGTETTCPRIRPDMGPAQKNLRVYPR